MTDCLPLFTRSKLPWLRLPEGATVFETAYKIDDVRPAASKERLRRKSASDS
jgi:hypothetical protein